MFCLRPNYRKPDHHKDCYYRPLSPCQPPPLSWNGCRGWNLIMGGASLILCWPNVANYLEHSGEKAGNCCTDASNCASGNRLFVKISEHNFCKKLSLDQDSPSPAEIYDPQVQHSPKKSCKKDATITNHWPWSINWAESQENRNIYHLELPAPIT